MDRMRGSDPTFSLEKEKVGPKEIDVGSVGRSLGIGWVVKPGAWETRVTSTFGLVNLSL